ncbi:DUF2554 family protein [Salmonella enterica]|nr:DUF2554 family protein [Salmonella enterica]
MGADARHIDVSRDNPLTPLREHHNWQKSRKPESYFR